MKIKHIVMFLILFSFWGTTWSAEPVKKEPTSLTLWQLATQSGTHMMSYLMKTADGQLIVVDGGKNAESKYLLKMILDNRPDGQVSLWVLTHPHSDHYGALAELLQTAADKFSIKTLCYEFPDRATIDRIEPVKGAFKEYRDKYSMAPERMKQFKNIGEIKIPHKNDRYVVGNITCTVMNDMCPEFDKFSNGLNDCSVCWRIDTGKTSILFLGDLGVQGGRWLLASQKPETLQCDYTQVAHHGHYALTEEQYKVLKPRRCLWPTNEHQWKEDHDNPFSIKQTKKWMKQLGVIENYVAKDGTLKLELP